jgi:hypothetical protein
MLTPDFAPTTTGTAKAHFGAKAYVSSNTSGTLGIYGVGLAVSNPASVGNAPIMLSLPYADADGVVYDGKRNALYHVNRSDNRLVALSDIASRTDGELVTPSAMGPATFMNGREATMYNNKVVVADDVTPGKLYSYHVNTEQISSFRTHDTGIELWGIQATGKDLWAIEDVTDNLVYFQDFFRAKSGPLSATATVSIEGLTRTHGLNYDESTDVMVLTDIGSAGSATDGGLIIITGFMNKFLAAGNGGTIAMADQIRIYGPSTELGNPVDVAVQAKEGAIFVAERAQQKFLVFAIPTSSCDCAPVFSTAFAGASAVTIDFD